MVRNKGIIIIIIIIVMQARIWQYAKHEVLAK